MPLFPVPLYGIVPQPGRMEETIGVRFIVQGSDARLDDSVRKYKELNDPKSCMSKAHDFEPTFVLLGRDITASWTILIWCLLRVICLKNRCNDAQIREARALAAVIRREHRVGSVIRYKHQ